MLKFVYYFILLVLVFGTFSCSKQPSEVERLREHKRQNDSITYVQAKKNLDYSDSLLQELLPQVDPILKDFVYIKDEKAEDHGRYVYHTLETSSNFSRNFMQAYVSDNRQVSVQSYYYGAAKLNQRAFRLSAGNDYVEKEGSNHVFNAEGWHEILTIEGEDALCLLAYITNHVGEPVQAQCCGNKSVSYTLSYNDQQALTQTYQLAVIMRNIDALERAVHVADLQIQKYEKKHTNSK